MGGGTTPLYALRVGARRGIFRIYTYDRNFRFDVYGRILFRKNIVWGMTRNIKTGWDVLIEMRIFVYALSYVLYVRVYVYCVSCTVLWPYRM